MANLGEYALPVMILLIVGHGLFRKVSVFDVFLSGAMEGLQTAATILPTLVGLITAVTMFKASGAFDLLSVALNPLAGALGLPSSVIPLMLIHPISGSGGMAVLTDILDRFGPDSTVGRIASVMCGSSETTFYAVTVYYGACGVTSTRHTLPCALIADFAAAVLSGVGVRLFMDQVGGIF